ncbi:hypothetical protein JCGZ_12816 [Jatropha curcas]|uniref:Uncharacterized protein n=1 Tax=Jatropha curcas TaxID=180498 RepID=A0A067KDW8_JATCU|nr:hypothetical protein JCGZ_12816 [Jatropha curcas]
MAVVVGMPEHGPGASFSFILDHTGQTAQGMLKMHLLLIVIPCPYLILQVSIDDYNEVCQLYEAARLKLAMARLSDEHVSRASMAPPAGRGQGTQCGGRTGRGAGHKQVVIEEAKETSNNDSEEIDLYRSWLYAYSGVNADSESADLLHY